MNKAMAGILSASQGLLTVQSEFARYQEANFPKRPLEFFGLELAGEAGEVANNEKKLWEGRDISDEKISDETADVFIALVNYANSKGINLADAVGAKLHYIKKVRVERSQQGLDY